MQENKNVNPSFARISTLLLFSLMLILITSLITYIFLSSQQTQEVQPPIYQQIVPSIVRLPTISYPSGNRMNSSTSMQTFDPTVNWETYRTNSKAKIQFQIKYPKEMYYISPVKTSELPYFHEPINDTTNVTGEGGYDIAPALLENPNKLPLKELVKKSFYYDDTRNNNLNTLIMNEFNSAQYTKETIGEYTVYKTDAFGTGYGPLPVALSGLVVFITPDNGNNYISFALTGYDKDAPSSLSSFREKYLTIFNQMLSTFRFLDQTQTNDLNIEGKMCGGITGIQCLAGYTCKLEGNYPDASGECVKN